MTAPVIGLTTYREQAAWGVWDQPADLLPTQYADAVRSTGGIPVLLPPVAEPGAADEVVARLDGLVISGGADVDPGRYGADPHERTAGWRPDRDDWEAALLTAAEARGAAGARRVPRHAADGRACRRHARPAHPGSGRPRAALPRRRRLRHRHGRHRARVARRRPGRRGAARSAVTTTSRWRPTPASWPRRTPATAPWRPWRHLATGSASAVQWHPETAADVGLLAGLVRAAADLPVSGSESLTPRRGRRRSARAASAS